MHLSQSHAIISCSRHFTCHVIYGLIDTKIHSETNLLLAFSQEELNASATHAVLSTSDLANSNMPSHVKIVSPAWLQDSLAGGDVKNEDNYAVVKQDSPQPAALSLKAENLQRWLGPLE